MKKLQKLKIVNILLFLLVLLIWTGCKTENIKPVTESVKDLTGTWKIVNANRNGKSLLPLVDSNYINFNKFNIVFKDDSYTLVNPLPFIVSQNGTYSLDNPQYPFTITFKQTGATTSVSTAFNYPIVNGVRILTLVFSPGCPQNTYSYSLQKVN
ncbi:DUF5004 domain-containing protein [Mucilaginibacter sp.]